MTERINALTVVLSHDVDEAHAAEIARLINCIHGVLDVTAHAVKNPESYVALTRTRRDVYRALHRFFDERAMQEREG
jgi:hypothetical protein